jgi:predicted outer membrane protein
MNKKKLSLTMMMLLSLAACGGSGSSGTGNPQAAAGTTMTQADSTVATTVTAVSREQFLMDAYQDGLREIQLSQQALQKGENDRVKTFAQRMIDDHTRLNNQIQQLAQSNNITLPNDLSASQKSQLDQLATLSGAAFDRAYMSRNVEVHQKDLAAAKLQAQQQQQQQQQQQPQQGSDDMIGQLVETSMPLIEIHLALAEEINSLLDPAVFVTTLYRAGLAEIRWSELALQKATDSRVKEFAQQMIDDHRQANERLTTLAQQNNVTLPTELTPDQQVATDDLARFTGADFDKNYLDKNVVAHLKAVRLARQQVGQGSTTETRELALVALPVLGSHLLRAIDLDLQIEPSFLYKAYQDGKAEILLANLALTQASNEQVKAFARQMITDHTAANAEIAQLAQQNNLALPVDISPEQLRNFVLLANKSGAEFDRDYMDINVQNHRKAVADATEQSQSATDADIKALAEKALPTLNAHLTKANDIRQQLPAS